MEVEDGENSDAFDDFAIQVNRNNNDENKVFTRFRNNSYYKAVGSSETGVRRNFAVRKRADDEGVRARALLYQQYTERGLDDDMEDDEQDTSMSSSPTSLQPNNKNHTRPLWCNLPSVRNSGILLTISPKERKRQEAMYELYTSEQSYLRSLNILHNVFMKSDQLRATTIGTDYHHLFSNMQEVLNCSKNFLSDLDRRIRRSPDTIEDLCDIITLHVAEKKFNPYITYCSNEVYQQRAFQKLLLQNPDFVQAMKTAEANPSCMNLPLHSFLLLPMQRITRLPLLVDMIRQRCDITCAHYETASNALRETSRLVKVCNETANQLQRTEDMIALQRQLEFKTRSFALISPSRFLLKRGLLIKLTDETVLGFRKLTKQKCHVFLFSDVIIIANKKGDEKYTVNDFCYRHRLKLIETDDEENAFQLVLERNQDGKRVGLRLQADCPSTCARWITCLRIVTKKEPKLGQSHIQVKITRLFHAEDTDCISLQPADVLCVLQYTTDGWYYGERLIDGRRGWFPSSHAKEILNEKMREKNIERSTRIMGIETQI
ncbi:rho guanine nucleotide exchange factor 26-like [Styela clava]